MQHAPKAAQGYNAPYTTPWNVCSPAYGEQSTPGHTSTLSPLSWGQCVPRVPEPPNPHKEVDFFFDRMFYRKFFFVFPCSKEEYLADIVI